MSYRTLITSIIFACGLFAFSVAAYAFKIDTHLWVAQQVYNDVVDDGKITVKLSGRMVTIPVSGEVVSAIRNHRDAFLLGSMGPDALPDVVAGQMLVHPGNSQGWKTNDWLTHILEKSKGSQLGTALAYGYMTHASADVFSHTYVNQYAGDIFILADGETLAEQRHVALESYITKHTPPYLDNSGLDLGKPYQLVTLNDDVAKYIRDVLVYDPQASAEYAKSGFTSHLPAYVAYRNKILEAAQSDYWNRIDAAIARIAAMQSGYAISAGQAQELINLLNTQIIPAIQAGQDVGQQMFNDLTNAAIHIDGALANFALGQVNELNNLQKQIDDLIRQRNALGERLACPNLNCKWWDGGCKAKQWELDHVQCPIITQTNARIDALLTQASTVRNQQLQTATELRNRLEMIRAAIQDIANRLFDLGQLLSSNTSPVKALMTNWVSDLDLAMAEYVKAAANTMINTMNPDAKNYKHGVITPMVEWFDCYNRTLAGLPSAVGTGQCGFQGQIDKITKAFNDIVEIINDATNIGTYAGPIVGLPTPAEVRAKADDLLNRTKQSLIDAAVTELKKLIPPEISDMLNVLSEDMTDARLQYYYSKPETGSVRKNLLMIPDIDRRIKAEMSLTTTGVFDPQKYAVVYDSVVLAKLSLLDNAGLAQLAQAAGVPNRADGTPLFNGVDNVIAHAVASIDGNHQWMSVAAPYPNSVGAPYKHPEMPGYPWFKGYSSATGLILWLPEARSSLFRGLFIGPLSPGVEAPDELQMPSGTPALTAILPADYPYRPCRAYPFPDDELDNRCKVIKLQPILFNFLLY
jgi:hypothetical protein